MTDNENTFSMGIFGNSCKADSKKPKLLEILRNKNKAPTPKPLYEIVPKKSKPEYSSTGRNRPSYVLAKNMTHKSLNSTNYYGSELAKYMTEEEAPDYDQEDEIKIDDNLLTERQLHLKT